MLVYVYNPRNSLYFYALRVLRRIILVVKWGVIHVIVQNRNTMGIRLSLKRALRSVSLKKNTGRSLKRAIVPSLLHSFLLKILVRLLRHL